MLNDDESGRLDVMERWMNIAPVKDFVAVEGEDKQVVGLGLASAHFSLILLWRRAPPTPILCASCVVV